MGHGLVKQHGPGYSLSHPAGKGQHLQAILGCLPLCRTCATTCDRSLQEPGTKRCHLAPVQQAASACNAFEQTRIQSQHLLALDMAFQGSEFRVTLNPRP